MKIKTAVCGYGHLGKWHCGKVNLCENATLYAIVEPLAEQRALAFKNHPQVKIVEHLDDILAEIDAAIIVTPTSTHFELVDLLLKRNIDVFCEKPLCSTRQEARQIEQLVDKSSAILQVGHSERFHQAWQIIHQNPYYNKFLESVGTLRISRLAPFKGRAVDVDVVQDLMVHDIDLLSFLFFEKPINVISTGYKIRTSNWDYVCSEFGFASGRRAIMTVGRNHIKEVRELEYTSPNGCMYIDMFGQELLIAPKDMARENSRKISDFVECVPYEKQDHLLIEQDYFFKSITDRSLPIVSASDGIWAVDMISSVLQSLESNILVNI